MAFTHVIICPPQTAEGLFEKFKRARFALFQIFESEGAFKNPHDCDIITQPPSVAVKPFDGETLQTFQTQTYLKGILELNCSYFFYTLNEAKTSQHVQISMVKTFPGVMLFSASATETVGRLVTAFNLDESTFVSDAGFAKLKQFCDTLLAEPA